jgi:hypothetical protein
MPNWCYNSLVVSGNTEAELQEFLDLANRPHMGKVTDWRTLETVSEEVNGVFWNFIRPADEDLDDYFAQAVFKKSEAEIGSDEWHAEIAHNLKVGKNWYHWNVREWGTKWDVFIDLDEISITENLDGTYSFCWYFETAWSPAEPAYHAMARCFPNLTFEYEITEEANFYAGKVRFENGELASEVWVDSPTHADYAELDIPCVGCWGESDEDCSLADEEEAI